MKQILLVALGGGVGAVSVPSSATVRECGDNSVTGISFGI